MIEATHEFPKSRFVGYPQFESKVLGNSRGITVYLPPGYDHGTASYPVFYFQDGQNIFDPGTAATGIAWDAALIADRLIYLKRIRPLIMVAINNTPERLPEYTLYADPLLNVPESKGERYGKFLVEEVKPYIEKTYRTLPDKANSGIIGSSMGGLISLSLAWKHPEVFGMCGVLSPSLWWAKGKILKDLHEGDKDWMHDTRFWLDMGNKEGSSKAIVPPGIARTRKLAEIFDRAGLLIGRDYYYHEVIGGEHNEAHWASRMGNVFKFFLGK